MFLLEIVTFGIYRLYYLIKTRREMMDRNSNVKIMSPAFLLVPIGIIIATFIGMIVALIATASTNVSNSCASTYSSYSTTATSSTLQNCSSHANVAPLIIMLVFYLAIPAAFVFYVIWIWSYSHGVEEVTENKLGFALSLIILILVPDGIDILVIQDYFNKLSPVAVDTNSSAPPAGLDTPNTPTEPLPPQPTVTPSEDPVVSSQIASTPSPNTETPPDLPESPTNPQ